MDTKSAWPMLARDDELARAQAALTDDAELRGVVLVGESGVGKSMLARTLAEAAASRGQPVRFVLGTRTGSDVPLGAFSRAITVDARCEPAALLAAAHNSLAQQDNLLVVVDDAHLLDPLSAMLVYQLAAERTAQLVVTIRSGNDVPDAVTALLKERSLLDLRVREFTRQQTATVVRAVLDGAVGDELVDALYDTTAGNPRLLRGLLASGSKTGGLARTDGGWRLRGSLQPDRELHDLIALQLRSLASEELTVVEILAIADLLDWSVLRSVCDADAAERLERRGWIELVADGSHLVARLHHRIAGEVALELAGVVRTRKLNGVLAQAFQRYLRKGGRCLRLPDQRGWIRLAQFLMRSDLPADLDLTVEAAEAAMTLAHIAAGIDLARFALEHGAGSRAAILLADALHWQGRFGEAEEILGGLDPDGSDPVLTARWTCLRAMNLFEGCGQVDAAREMLADLRGRLDAADAIDLLVATEASFAFYSGDVTTAIDVGLPVCATDAYPPAVTRAAMSTSWALVFAGRFADAARVAQAGVRATVPGTSGTKLLTTGLAEAVASAHAGHLAVAEGVVRGYAASATTAEARAVIDLVDGFVQLLRGELSAACTALRRSVSAPSRAFHPPELVLASAWSAQAEAARGDLAAAHAALRRGEQVYRPQFAVFLPELELARGWVHAADGQTTAAQQDALRAAQLARRAGMFAVEIRALHTAIRFGDRSHAARVDQLSRMLGAPLPEVMGMHAAGMANRDGDLLDDAANRFADLGALALAADAAAQAANEYARQRKAGRQLASSARSKRLVERIGLRSPATVATARPLPITAREREIAMLVAVGMSNREIADRLTVSVRTVDGHLYRLFTKLGIQSRDELAQLLAA